MNDTRTSELWKWNYVVCFSLNSDIEKAPENLQVELVNMQCDTLNQVICEIKYKDFILIHQKKKFLYSGIVV
jgi:hypothetical protein